jgi:cation:H+ antiporter
MLLHAVLFTFGLTALYFGAGWLVRGSARLARAHGVSPVVVGLTIVAFGTSTPELVVSVLAAVRDQADLAVGNVVGSNIANVAVILGLSALLSPFTVALRLLAREIPLMIMVTLALPLLALDGTLGRLEGAVLLLAFGAFIVFVLRSAGGETPAVAAEYEEFETAEALIASVGPAATNYLLIGAGLAGLLIGAHALVESAVFFAEAMGVSQIVIGLTIVAIGTSLPELATSLVAAARGEGDIALGNAVGSNMFNLLAILGTAAAIRPIEVAPALLTFEIPVMVLTSVLLLPLALTRRRVERWEGGVLLSIYVVFIALLILRA